jgi:tungstate transport system substrate-binding protein
MTHHTPEKSGRSIDMAPRLNLKSCASLVGLVFLIIVGLGFAGCQFLGTDSEAPASSFQNNNTNRVIILATTTSTQDSGLLDILIPVFQAKTGYIVKAIAVGTGQALKMGARGDADILLVHAPEAEKVLINDRSAIERKLVMHNDFVVVGPPDDPAAAANKTLAPESFKQIADTGSTFVSRGDDSGTHKREVAIWNEAEISPAGDWYLESGQGMGATLRIASEKRGYTLTDRGTYLALQHTLDLKILIEGDQSLINPYHVMRVNPDKWPAVNHQGAEAWSDFLLSPEVQALIGHFGQEEFGRPLFIPDGGKSEEQLGSD